ncbi:hypothetical protein [Streptomyces sp. NPDC005955]|uniref:hypothetical protein n=1 Tax=Streptomyces sp. NPDC005955 TaxID=3364738 RepID=UPI0036A04B13
MRTGQTQRTATAWQRLTAWLRRHAPTSYASILPPATEAEIEEAEDHLGRRCGYGFPPEPVTLWSLADRHRSVPVGCRSRQVAE